ncbi:MAG TPA: cupin domain-containing protein [Dehalococcoidia bacterium]|nr:cupin domain-containing protein [Dehalococcoidia bacterium]
MPGYVLHEAEGRSFRWWDYLFTIKASAAETEHGIAIMEFSTEKGREPPVHVHNGEDEVFYVLSGELTFTCGDKRLEAGPKDFVFLPRDIEHAYEIHSDGLVELLVITIATRDEGFGARIETTGSAVTRDDVLAYRRQVEGQRHE